MPFWPWSRSSHHSSSSYRPGYARSASSYSRTGSSSYYRRRSRDGYVERLVHKFKHLLRELWYYLRRNPVKVFFLVIMPLVSGGALAAVASQFGVKLPGFLSGKNARGMSEAFGGGREGFGGGRGGGMGAMAGAAEGLGGMGGNIGTLMNLAKMFV